MVSKHYINQYLIPITVFLTGASVLIIEITATRILSPYFGNTIYSVSSIISTILAALSIGYYYGGKMADKNSSLNIFFRLIIYSGVTVLISQTIGSLIILPVIAYSLPITIGSLISSLVLFFIPALLLGTLSPYAIKIQKELTPKEGIGSISGRIFFFSTFGSIFGSIATGFVFIPTFGVNEIILVTGFFLVFLGSSCLVLFSKSNKKALPYLVFAAFLLMTGIWLTKSAKANAVLSLDGIYERITVYDSTYQGRPTRFLQQDRTASAAMYLDNKDLVYDYTKYYALYKGMNKQPEQILALGGGAYTIPIKLLEELPDATIDVAEIEPSLPLIAEKYFDLPKSANLNHVIQDGRRYLHSSNKKYDLIFSDVYFSLFSVPVHFTTQEFFAVAKDKLNQDGIFIANIIGKLSEESPSFTMSEIKTFKSVFPNSYVFATESPDSYEPQNFIFVGINGSEKISYSGLIREDQEVDIEKFSLDNFTLLTDNYAPVEYLNSNLINNKK